MPKSALYPKTKKQEGIHGLKNITSSLFVEPWAKKTLFMKLSILLTHFCYRNQIWKSLMAWIQSESGISSLAPPLGIQIYGQLTCTEGDAIYCVGEFCNSELDFDKTKEKTGKFSFPVYEPDRWLQKSSDIFLRNLNVRVIRKLIHIFR